MPNPHPLLKRVYHTSLGSGAAAAAAFAAVLLVSGDWKAVAVSVVAFAGMAFLVSIVLLGIASERAPAPAAWTHAAARPRSAPAEQPAPAPEPTRERTGRPAGRLSSAPS